MKYNKMTGKDSYMGSLLASVNDGGDSPFYAERTVLAEIDGVNHEYDACGTGDLDALKASYKLAFPEYIGSGTIYWVSTRYSNGWVRNEHAEVHHYFKRRTYEETTIQSDPTDNKSDRFKFNRP